MCAILQMIQAFMRLKDLAKRLEHDANLATKWFDCNCMKQNEEKCHLIISGHKSEAIWAKIG